MPALRLRRDPSLFGGIFVLGMASGVTSACCAPVLAGVAAMSALAASTAGVLGLGLAYVFGMVFPLFLAALLFGSRAAERVPRPRRRIRFAGSDLLWTDLVAGGLFSVMAALALYLAASGQSTLTPGWLTGWGRWAASLAAGVAVALQGLPPYVQALLLLALAAALAAVWRPAAGRRGAGRHRPAARHSADADRAD